MLDHITVKLLEGFLNTACSPLPLVIILTSTQGDNYANSNIGNLFRKPIP